MTGKLVRMVRALLLTFLGMLALSGGGLFLSSNGSRAQAPQTVEAGLEALTLNTQSGSHHFRVEVMRTEAQRARGLMYRRSMPDDRGMLFDFRREEPVAMWMKNTYLPLDMVFIDRRGTVVNIVENTEPLSERTIPSGAPTYAVLELNAGTVRRIRLKMGDTVRHQIFRP